MEQISASMTNLSLTPSAKSDTFIYHQVLDDLENMYETFLDDARLEHELAQQYRLFTPDEHPSPTKSEAASNLSFSESDWSRDLQSNDTCTCEREFTLLYEVIGPMLKFMREELELGGGKEALKEEDKERLLDRIRRIAIAHGQRIGFLMRFDWMTEERRFAICPPRKAFRRSKPGMEAVKVTERFSALRVDG